VTASKNGVAPQVYSSKIIKAGALPDDTRTLLTFWNPERSARENLADLREGNLLGKASRSRVEDVLAIFQQRYLRDADVASSLSVLERSGLPQSQVNPILFFYSAQSDRLLHDVVIGFLHPLYRAGRADVSVAATVSFLREQVRTGRTSGNWSDATLGRVARGLLSTLRDFGVLRGAAKKRVATVFLPVSAFAYLAFSLHEKERSGERLINSPEWSLFFLEPNVVERLLIEAQQQHLLGKYCATDDDAAIDAGLRLVNFTVAENFAFSRRRGRSS
jgi:hypothetical protein